MTKTGKKSVKNEKTVDEMKKEIERLKAFEEDKNEVIDFLRSKGMGLPTYSDINHTINELRAQLKEADDVIEFYANENVFDCDFRGDTGVLYTWEGSDHDSVGKRAREYQKKYGDKK